MPSAIGEIVKRRVIEQWISGDSRDKIAAENNIGAGTVTSIVNNYKVELENSDFGSVRELMAEAKKQ
jgi:transposase